MHSSSAGQPTPADPRPADGAPVKGAERALDWRIVLALVLLSAVGTALLYLPSVDYGFYWDDYHQVRHYSLGEVLRTFHDDWDPIYNCEPRFYRPTTIALYALRFELLGFDPRAYHWFSLGMLAAMAVMTGLFVLLVTESRVLAVLTAALFVAHPTFVHSLAIWACIQEQSLTMLCILAALLYWWFCKERGAAWWIPLFALEAIAFGSKEDGIMLLPCLLAIDLAHGKALWPEEELPLKPRLYALAFVFMAALVAFRQYVLGGLGGYPIPELDDMLWRGMRGPSIVLSFRYGIESVQLYAAFFSCLLLIPGTLLSCREVPSRGKTLVAAGWILIFGFNLIYFYSTKRTQLHALGLGHVLLLVGSIRCLCETLPGWPIRLALAPLVAAGLVLMAVETRGSMLEFEPFSHGVVLRDIPVWARWKPFMAPEMIRVLEDKWAARGGVPKPPPVTAAHPDFWRPGEP